MKFFVLGAHPELSIAEIEAVIPSSSSTKQGREILLLETATPSVELQERLAGCVKIGTVVGSLKGFDKQKAADLIRSHVEGHDGKVQFGISTYDKRIAKEMQPLGLEVKKRLKADGVSCRLVTSRESALSSVVVSKNHLLEKGGEFVILTSPSSSPLERGSVLIGKTETVQDFERWGERDFGRPARNAKSGMLPPKLARMMLNLTGLEPTKSSVLDPFCGSGTVLMEALLLGFKKIYGSDISQQAIADTKINLDWLAVASSVHVQQSDADGLKLKEQVDSIVTEPFLGRPQKGGETSQQLEAIRRELLDLYEKTFSHLITLVKPQGRLVVSFPIIGEVPVVPKIKSVQVIGAPLRYEREGQRIGRLIVRWGKV